MIWVWGAIAIAFAAISGYAAIQHSGKLQAQAETKACQTQVATMGEQIKQQNAAVDSLKATADAKAATASQELRKAEGRAQVWDAQAKRLQAILAGRKGGPQDCKAAWGDIRGGK